jgi:hypothetical protein
MQTLFIHDARQALLREFQGKSEMCPGHTILCLTYKTGDLASLYHGEASCSHTSMMEEAWLITNMLRVIFPHINQQERKGAAENM